MHNRSVALLLSAAVLLIIGDARAGILTFTTTPLDGGLFRYDFTIDNTTGSEQISGLLLLKGNSAFGLDQFSTINAPANWGFFPPDPGPPLIDSVDYFSFDPGSDVAVGTSLEGFSFESSTDPLSLGPSDLGAILVGGLTDSQTPVTARYVPEPATWVQLCLALAGSGLLRSRQSGAVHA